MQTYAQHARIAASLTRQSTHHPTTHQLAARRQHSASARARLKSEIYPPKTYSQTLTLPDGRSLGYAEAGALKGGRPLMWFHGTPGSRYDSVGLDALCRELNIHLVVPERPGYGLSTFAPRRMVDWPADVRALQARLGWRRFGIVGVSGGGPFALACARAMPTSLNAVGLVSSSRPGMQGLAVANRIGRWLCLNWPWLYRKGVAWEMGRLISPSFLEHKENQLLEAITSLEEDEKHPGAPLQRQEWLDGHKNHVYRHESFATGVDGYLHESRMLVLPYGFRFEDVCYNKIHLWHGTLDKACPIRGVRDMAKQLPYSQLHEFGGETHASIGKHLGMILTQLAKGTKC